MVVVVEEEEEEEEGVRKGWHSKRQ